MGKLPRQRSLTREGGSYSKPLIIANITAIFRSSIRSLDLTFTTSFTRHHPLLMKSAGIPYRVLAVFASQRKIVSSANAGNVPPEKKASSVYRRVR
jgi:hypothetical protein